MTEPVRPGTVVVALAGVGLIALTTYGVVQALVGAPTASPPPAPASPPATPTPAPPTPPPTPPPNSGAGGPDASPPTPLPGPLPTTPANDFSPPPKGASSFNEQNPKPPFDHIMILYTSRWLGDHWGPWDGPTSYDGRQVSPATFWQKAVWVNPQAEMVEYLEDLALTDSTLGYWAAYALPLIEDANGTHYGPPAQWTSGHFGGEVKNGDGTHVTVYLGTFGLLSEYSARKWA